MTEPDFVRARRPEHKQQRRAAILDAARELARRDGVRSVSLAGVAAAVGFAKSNVTRYFGTREEIYLELTAECWRDWEQAVLARIPEAGPVEALVETVAERPLFCDLLSQVTITLEHNVSVPAAREFKRGLHGIIRSVGAAVAAHSELTESEGIELVTAAGALAGLLYAAANPSATMRELYAQEPEIAAMVPTFEPTLKRALAALVAGMPSLRA
ncbi:TetR/AcrR family transcriptional regulator [Allokutzneria albata]|uniref:DNA-binding transcriptional regulator, AcrR family n=1 Tax=Allokutzneria albata TaxID=211114 RepID=A0A1G9UJJ1_ALLAB|nr:TetR family transcriptional regulator [Allokutzneria albata]SDM60120.1 DNA-binding transcriptional regulator, AcrR family [Allokutzneria albata]